MSAEPDKSSLSPFAIGGDDRYRLGHSSFLETVAKASTYKPEALRIFEQGLTPGAHILDAGAGNGIDLAHLSKMVGQSGTVTAVDYDANLVAEARAPAQQLGLTNVQLQQADILHLPFPADSFQGVRADRVFQHISDPRAALGSLTGVLAHKGILVISDPMWEQWRINHPDQETTLAILQFKRKTNIRNGMVASDLVRWFSEAGLSRVDFTEVHESFKDPDIFKAYFYIEKLLEKMMETHAIKREAAERWYNQLPEALQRSDQISTLPIRIVSGYK